MFMPMFNMGFGFGGGYYSPCCCCCNPFGLSPFVTNPFFTNMVIYNPFMMTNLCSVPSFNNYNFQASYNYQTPDVSAFIPKIDFSQYTAVSTPTYNFSMDGFYNNLVSTISKNVTSVPQTASQTVTQQQEKSSTSSTSTTKPKDISYDAEKLESKWKNSKYASRAKHLPSEFFQKVVDISKKINCNPDDLMAVMNAESGLSASAKNSSSGATGLIQFTETTANNLLNTTCEQLAKMTETEQLDYVEKYFVDWKKTDKLGDSYLDLATLYALVFAPANANKEVLYAENSAGYKGNSSLDKDGKNGISKSEAEARVMEFMA